MEPTLCRRLIPPSLSRGLPYRWLLDLEYAGRTWRLTDGISIDLVDASNTVYRYHGGLTVGTVEEALDLFSSTPTPRSVSVSIQLPGIDVAELVEQGHLPERAEGILYVWYSGHLEDRRPVLTGRLVQATVGQYSDPLEAALEEAWGTEDAGRMVDGDRVVTDTSWPQHDTPTLTSQVYQLVFGYPGRHSQQRGYILDVTPAVPGYQVVTGGAVASVQAAGHRVQATQVALWDYGTSTSYGYVAVAEAQDFEARIVTTGTQAGPVAGAKLWTAWYPTYGGGLVEDGVLVRGAGDVLAYALHRSSLRVDWGSLAGLRALQGHAVDTYCNEDISPWEWLTGSILPFLPVSVAGGAWGIRLVPWRWWATAQDASIHLDTSRGASLISRQTWDARDPTANRITVRYVLCGPTGEYLYYRTAAAEVDLDDDWVTVHPRCIASVQRYGEIPLEVEIPICYDDATAGLYLEYLVQRYALPQRVCTVQVGAEAEYVREGDVATLTDEGSYQVDAVWHVERKRYVGGAIELDLRRWS